MRWIVVVVTAVMVCGLFGSVAGARVEASPGEIAWVHLLGSAGDEQVNAIATDAAGDVYAVGTTTGQLPNGAAFTSGSSPFIVKYSHTGTLKWVRQLGPATAAEGDAVTVGDDGTIYLAGDTGGALRPSERLFGDSDAFVAAFSAAGSLRWLRIIGGSGPDTATGVAPLSGGVVVSGDTTGLPGLPSRHHVAAGFVMSIDGTGTPRWATLIGGTSSTTFDTKGVATDCAGDVFTAGNNSRSRTTAPIGFYGESLDTDGALRWLHPLSQRYGQVVSMTADCSGELFISGWARVKAGGHPYNRSLTKLASDGSIVYSGGTWYEQMNALVADPAHDLLYEIADNNTFYSNWMSTGAIYESRGFPFSDLHSSTGTLDPAGNVDLGGATPTGLTTAPEPYAGGATDAVVSQITNPGWPYPS